MKYGVRLRRGGGVVKCEHASSPKIWPWYQVAGQIVGLIVIAFLVTY